MFLAYLLWTLDPSLAFTTCVMDAWTAVPWWQPPWWQAFPFFSVPTFSPGSTQLVLMGNLADWGPGSQAEREGEREGGPAAPDECHVDLSSC